jgi:PAS domain S-box-containing protein
MVDQHDPHPNDLVQQRLAIALDAAGIGSWELDLATREFRGDARLLELFGFPADTRETRIEAFARLLPREHRTRVNRNLERSIADGSDYYEEYPVRQPDGSLRWVAAHGRPLYTAEGVLDRMVGSAYDTTAQHATAAQVEATSQLLALIASASEVLAGSLEIGEVVRSFTRLVVPTLADWSIMTLVEDGVLRDVEWWHRDAARREATTRFAEHRLAGRQEAAGSLLAFTSRQPFLVNDDAEAYALRTLRSDLAVDAVGELDLGSVAVFPLVTESSEVIGLLTLARDSRRPGFSDEEVSAAIDLCRRMTTTLENAWSFGRQRDMSEQLQRSMLTEPVQPEHVEVVVRYLPAAKAAQVGGDWYDAFTQVDGSTVLVVGDVVGHDSVAAAVMGQLRSMMRGIAVTSGAGPARLLKDLDGALHTLRMATYATVVVARVEVDGAAADGGEDAVTLRWSTAGHPPPLLAEETGEVRVLDVHDTLLGVSEHLPRTEHTIPLPAGSTLLLYTDGLVERRDEDIDVGIERLQRLLSGLARTPLPEAVDELVHRLVPGDPDDDVVLLAMRVAR